MTRGETTAHATLKRCAVIWAQEQGFRAVAVEVRLPKSNYRADIAAYQRRATAIFECKQARADFLKDSRFAVEAQARLKTLDARQAKLEELLKVHFPSLRKGEMLFEEFDAVNLAGFEHATYRRVLREIEVQQRRLYGKTKFEKLVRYRCANLNYLVIEPGILAPHEVPVGWGLLVRRAERLVLEREPLWQEVAEPVRRELLEKIAAAGTRVLNRELGISVAEFERAP